MMKKNLLVFLFSAFLFSQLGAEDIPLWPKGTPHTQEGVADSYRSENDKKRGAVMGIHTPRLIPFFADSSVSGEKKAALIICPGGGYSIQSSVKEGAEVAEYFRKKGMQCFVLRYRLPTTQNAQYYHPIPVSDVLRAIQVVRAQAAEWNIDAEKIGVIGFSAGGHLAATAGTQFAKMADFTPVKDAISEVSARPDFLALGYPVITTEDGYRHGCVSSPLAPEKRQGKELEELSCEKNVTAETPPTFLFHAKDDKGVVPENSVLFHDALKKHGVSTELFLHEKGGHGYGLGRKGTDSELWPEKLMFWLEKQKVL